MHGGDNKQIVDLGKRAHFDARAYVLMIAGFGCFVGFFHMVSLGYVGYLSQGVLQSVDVWYGVRAATTLVVLGVLALAGWREWFKVGTTMLLLAMAAGVASAILFAVDEMGVFGVATAVLGGASIAVLMFVWMLLLSCCGVRQILVVTIGGFLVAGAIVMGAPLLDDALGIIVAVAAVFVAGAAALLASADSYEYELYGKLGRSAAARVPWLTVVMVLACGFLASVLYGVAEHLTWLYDWSPNSVAYVVAVIVTLAATIGIMVRSANWIHIVWAPPFVLLVLALGLSCFSVRESIQVAVGCMLAAVLCARMLYWMIFPALFSTLKIPRAFLAGLVLMVAEGSLADMLGDALGSVLPHSMQNLGGVAGIMILTLGVLFAVTYLVYHHLFGPVGLWSRSVDADSAGQGAGDAQAVENVSPEPAPEPEEGQAQVDGAADPVDAMKARMDMLAVEYGLTPREREVALMTVQGFSGAYISEKLFVSNSTVRFHQQNIYRKFDVHSRNELIEVVNSDS